MAGAEASAVATLHEESKAAVRAMVERDPGLRDVLDRSHAYAVFPAVGKAAAVVGGSFGKGEVFRGDQLVGYAALLHLTLGAQAGGQTFSQIVALRDEAALRRFKAGRTKFAAGASAVLVKAGAAASANYDDGAIVFVSAEGGMMLEASVGAQKFLFKPAALGRAKSAPAAAKPRGGKAAGAPKSKQSRRVPGKRSPTRKAGSRRRAARAAPQRPQKRKNRPRG